MTNDIDQKIALINEPSSPLELARMILDIALRGDYSNGNTAPDGAPGQGTDEGQVMVHDALAQYQVRLEEFEQMDSNTEVCPECKGEKTMLYGGTVPHYCYTCGGTGRIPKRVTVTIKQGWEGEGRTGQYLGRVMKDQWWAIVVWDDEEDPETFKFAGLTIGGSTQF